MKLNVFLGYACNFKCGYCLQAPDKQSAVRKSGDVSGFVERVIPQLAGKRIDLLGYWGGEPLLYWETIREIQSALFAAGVDVQAVRVTTNGSLLTPRIVGDLNAMGAHVVISDHGRFGSPAWDQVKNLKRFSLHFLFTHQALIAWPWFDHLRDIEEQIGRRVFPHVGWVRATDGCDPAYWLTEDDFAAHISHLWELARLRVGGDRLAADLLEGPFQEWVTAFQEPSGGVEALCYAADHVSVDLTGNRYVCHHSVDQHLKTGHLFETGRSPAERSAEASASRFMDTDECRSCPINRWCRGNCHRSNTHVVDCRLAKAKHQIFTWIAQQEGIDHGSLHHDFDGL